MSNMNPVEDHRRGIPELLKTSRTDPVYMAHAYLTKVPVTAITPFIEAFTSPGDVVLDPFAGSGMTGVAAAMSMRRARLFDVAVLGRHIGRNYINLVDPDHLRKRTNEALRRVTERLGDIYAVRCQSCGADASLVKSIWSIIMACNSCDEPVSFYSALERAGWNKKAMECYHCGGAFTSRASRMGEEPVVDWIVCSCSSTQIEQEWTPGLVQVDAQGVAWPDLPIEASRQMFHASALARHKLTSTAAFFSPRNIAVLGALRASIDAVAEEDLRDKLLFAFTGILTRASKRYQWSKKRPLNAANANYYVAPVFYEWNVFDLFERKVEAAIKSDDWIRAARGTGTLFGPDELPDVRYDIASAHCLPLPDDSVDYVFTDPPFGSNIFYSDMNLFQEAWLGETTDPVGEAVVDRVETGMERTSDRYERMLSDAFRECQRVLKPGGAITIVFGNSSGSMWALLQRSISSADLEVDPDLITVLDKGQRSVKGLASGFENVATLDLALTLRLGAKRQQPTHTPSKDEIQEVVDRVVGENGGLSPSHLYVELLREGIRSNWDLSSIDLRHVTDRLRAEELQIDRKTGRIIPLPVQS